MDFGGTPFVLDVGTLGWRQKDDPLNMICCNQMVDKGSHYELDFCTAIKRPRDPHPGALQNSSIVRISIPQMVDLAPIEVAALYGVPAAELPDRDSLLQSNPQRIEDRLCGQLPRMVLRGTEFTFDYDWLMLRQAAGAGIPLEGENVENELDGGFSFLYDPHTMQSVRLELGFTELPKDLLLVVLPCAARMDPVAFVREWQQPRSRLSNEFPQPDVIVPYQRPAYLHAPLVAQMEQNRLGSADKRTRGKKLGGPLPPEDEPGTRKGRRM